MNTVEFTALSAFRRSIFGSPNVGDTVQDPSIQYGDGSSESLDLTVTSVDPVNDIVNTEATFSHTYPSTGPFVVDFGSCCRLSPPKHRNNGDSNYNAQTIVDLSKASANASSNIQPIVDCPIAAVCQFTVPGFDPDGQPLRWRLATSAEAVGGGGTFTQPPGASIDPSNGLYTWDTTGASLNSNAGEDSFFSTQVVLEKVLLSGVSTKTPVDFFIRVGSKGSGVPPPVDVYVAMGDSYSSGFGATSSPGNFSDYESGTGPPPGGNSCYRSKFAYPRAKRLPGFTRAPFFIACNGNVTSDLTGKPPIPEALNQFRNVTLPTPRGNESPQFRQLLDIADANGGVGLVTVSIGGNDLGFGKVLEKCARNKWDPLHPGFHCQRDFEREEDIDKNIENIKPRLVKIYSFLKSVSPSVIVVGYPAIFPEDPSRLTCDVYRSDAKWLRDLYQKVDMAVQDAALKAGVTYLNDFQAFSDREVCSRTTDRDLQAANGITRSNGGSFHPNRNGHAILNELLADCVRRTLSGCRNRGFFLVPPNQRTSVSATISPGQGRATFAASWPGSDVVMSLTAPSGRVIERATTATDVFHNIGPTYESFSIESPEPGNWRVSRRGPPVVATGRSS